ncbi:L-threonylcarbamoyladenylate synthase [Vulcanococcus sp.]|jgi:L-threonylcarbamoyladenylate synthase|uniref:L-threonylcarbamoyladenylate synthase n=1 Tax=Vulcanococcus sp. TaxID=2856995 RepID=UPI003C1270D6
MTLIHSPEALASKLKAGSAAIVPTDTLPALAVRPENASLLWELKQRPREKPVILMAATPETLLECLGIPVQTAWQEMADRYWPGALTLVLPAKGTWLEQLNPGGQSLGLRLPAAPAALELMRHSGPLATTSANRSGEPACLDHEEARACFPEVPQLGPVPWPVPTGQGSTVIQWLPSGEWKLLRAGAVMPAELGENA